MIIENREMNLFRNRKIPRDKLPFDDILRPALLRQEKKRDRFEEDIIHAILDREETEIDSKPLEIVSESLKGYIKDLKDLQTNSTQEA